MIVPKLTVPLINDAILANCINCWIATGGISLNGFSFIFGRLTQLAHCQLLTGLDLPTDPRVLHNVNQNLSEKIEMRIFCEGFFHAKVYIFECRSFSVAYVGSGNFTMGGFNGNEELFYKVTDYSEIEELKAWFRRYFIKSIPLSRSIILQYEAIYNREKDRQTASIADLSAFMNSVNANTNGVASDLSGQYFKVEDYAVLSNANAPLTTPAIVRERIRVQNKLMDIHDLIMPTIREMGDLHQHFRRGNITSSLNPENQPGHLLRAIWLAYGRSEAEIEQYQIIKPGHPDKIEKSPMNFIRLQAILRQDLFGIWLMPGKEHGSEIDRNYFRTQMRNENYREEFYRMLRGLGDGYWINVAGDQESVLSFKNALQLWEFTRRDDWRHHYFTIGKNFQPNAFEIREANIVNTILAGFRQLYPLYRLMKDKSFERP